MLEGFEHIIDSEDSRSCCHVCGHDSFIGTHTLYITNKGQKICGGCKIRLIAQGKLRLGNMRRR